MSQPYVGEIRMFAGNFAPAGWALCNGQLLAISGNDALFTLIGTTFGGNGQTTFALPDLRGRVPVHQDTSHILGQLSGVETVTLTATQVPGHAHELHADAGQADSSSPRNNILSNPDGPLIYASGQPDASMAAETIAAAGASVPVPHDNVQPFLCINFIISLFGIFPTQT